MDNSLTLAASNEAQPIRLNWNPQTNQAEVTRVDSIFWSGSLLPSFLICNPDSEIQFYEPQGIHAIRTIEGSFDIHYQLGKVATVSCIIVLREDGLSMKNLQLAWKEKPLPIYAMLFGASLLTPEQQNKAGLANRNWWPDWHSWGMCVPSAKVGPMQSFFRCFEFGNACIPLGSFGPSMGTPYSAAFPRPTYSAAFGNENTWVCFGAGEIPDGAISLKIESSNACMEWLFREDLWGAPEGKVRLWKAPLEIVFDENAYDSFAHYFDRFPQKKNSERKNIDMWANWGEAKDGIYDIRLTAERIAEKIGASLLVIDDGWETFNSSGEIRRNRFPAFEDDLDYIRSLGIKVGLWQSVGWLDDIHFAGLSNTDVLNGLNQQPIQVDWAFNVRSPSATHYCPDPSSPKAIEFIRDRSRSVAQNLKPDSIKLDFSYGLPGPNISAPKAPSLRGERAAFTLLKTAADAFKEVDPNILICGYTLHPLFDDIQDFVSMDDLGDASYAEANGHSHWSIWASIFGRRGMPINASSAFNWNIDHELLLNAAVLGAPGAVLRLDQSDLPTKAMQLRRKALHRWYRKTSTWKPLWLNSICGNITGDSQAKSWGRLESINGNDQITALAIREGTPQSAYPKVLDGCTFDGSWAIISQGDNGIFQCGDTVLIPMSKGKITLSKSFISQQKIFAVFENHTETQLESSDEFLALSNDNEKNSNSGVLAFIVRKIE